MSYTEIFTIHLGTTQTGKTLTAQLYDTGNTASGALISTGFTEIGLGDYTLVTAVPDAFVGRINILVGGVYAACASIDVAVQPTNIIGGGATAQQNQQLMSKLMAVESTEKQILTMVQRIPH
jgi:hypothetical protein